MQIEETSMHVMQDKCWKAIKIQLYKLLDVLRLQNLAVFY